MNVFKKDRYKLVAGIFLVSLLLVQSCKVFNNDKEGESLASSQASSQICTNSQNLHALLGDLINESELQKATTGERFKAQVALLTILNCRTQFALDVKNSFAALAEFMDQLSSNASLKLNSKELEFEPTWDQLRALEKDHRADLYKQVQLEQSIASSNRADFLKMESQKLQSYQARLDTINRFESGRVDIQGDIIKNRGAVIDNYNKFLQAQGKGLENVEKAIKNQILRDFEVGYAQYVKAYSSYASLYSGLSASMLSSLPKIRTLQKRLASHQSQINQCTNAYNKKVMNKFRQAKLEIDRFNPENALITSPKKYYDRYAALGELGLVCYSHALVDNFMSVWERSSTSSRFRANPLKTVGVNNEVNKIQCIDDRPEFSLLFSDMVGQAREDVGGPSVGLVQNTQALDWVDATSSDLELLMTGSMFVHPATTRRQTYLPPVVSLLQAAMMHNVDDTTSDESIFDNNRATAGKSYAGCDERNEEMFDLYTDSVRAFELRKLKEWGQALKNIGVEFTDNDSFSGIKLKRGAQSLPYAKTAIYSTDSLNAMFKSAIMDADICVNNVDFISSTNTESRQSIQAAEIKELPEGSALTIGEKSIQFFAPQYYIGDTALEKSLSNAVKLCVDAANQSIAVEHRGLLDQKSFMDFYQKIQKEQSQPKAIVPYFTSPVPNATYY